MVSTGEKESVLRYDITTWSTPVNVIVAPPTP
jgi:hypothetical protein